jgi:DNA-binding HxlR family transcriptional regulator
MGFEEVKELFKRKRAIELLLLLEESGELNFKAIDHEIESSSDTISSTLKLMADYGLVERDQHSVNDVRYSITENGRNALEQIRKLQGTMNKED